MIGSDEATWCLQVSIKASEFGLLFPNLLHLRHTTAWQW
jgi:hypothetical protein